MSSLYQTNFNKNISINQRSKRLRHVTAISCKNLQIKAFKFNIWLTFHSFRTSEAFYISDKKENDHNPKFNLNINKLAYKEFIIRLWYSKLDIEDEPPSNRLNLLLEMELNLDYLIRLNDDNLKYSIKNFNNLLIFEIFGFNFCEPLGFTNDDENGLKISKVKEIQTKNSYSVNLMGRLHDFQRVIHETLSKINQLKNSSLFTFEASSKLRELQVRKEELLQKINLYKYQLNYSNRSICQLNEYNANLKAITDNLNEKLTSERERFSIERVKIVEINKNYQDLVKRNQLMQYKLKRRQKSLISDLARIFHTENKLEIVPSSNETTLHTRTRIKIVNLQFKNLNNNLANSTDDIQNSVVLGYIVHSILMLSTILNVPLRYPVIFRASKSYIIEQIKEDNICELPLFKQNSSGGQDTTLNHAIELLNKNIAQLRGLFDSFKNIDQKDMLKNLKWIFDDFSI